MINVVTIYPPEDAAMIRTWAYAQMRVRQMIVAVFGAHRWPSMN